MGELLGDGVSTVSVQQTYLTAKSTLTEAQALAKRIGREQPFMIIGIVKDFDGFGVSQERPEVCAYLPLSRRNIVEMLEAYDSALKRKEKIEQGEQL